jgi:hypothetical protein
MVQSNSVAERHYDVENDRRLTKQLAQHIGQILRGQHVEWWSFAAPADIHEAIVNQLDPSVRNRIAEHVSADLVKIPASELLDHFSAVRLT